MRALWIQNQQLTLKHDVLPTAVENGVNLTTRLAGICGTDLELLRGYYDFSGIPGHEFVAQISDGIRKGQRVVADINLGCGECSFCDRQLHKHCLRRHVIGIKSHSGAFAEHLIVPERNLVSIPDSVSDWQAVQLEPLAAALQVLEHIDAKDDSVLLVGVGRLGRMVSKVIAAYRPGVALTLYRRDDELPGTGSFDVAIDCSGSTEGLTIALNAVRAQGKLIVKSTYEQQPVVNMSRVVVDEIQILGSRCGSMQEALNSLEQGEITLSDQSLVYFSLDEFDEAFQAANDRSIEKVLFQF